MNADDPFAALRPDGKDTVPMLAAEPALRTLGGREGIRRKREAVREAVAAVETLPDWPPDRRRRLVSELRAVDSKLEAWSGFVDVWTEALEAAGWRYNDRTGKLEVVGAWNRARTLYNETVAALYDELKPAYVRDTGDLTKNPRALREAVAARLGPLAAEYLDPRAGKPLHNAVKNHVKNA